MSNFTLPSRGLIGLIMGAILVWGAVLAIGAYNSPQMEQNWLRTAVVYAFVVGFVGFWAALIWFRKMRDSGK